MSLVILYSEFFIILLIVRAMWLSMFIVKLLISQAAFHLGRPKYVWNELGKIFWHRKENPPCLGVLVTENPFYSLQYWHIIDRIVAQYIARLQFNILLRLISK